jgi:hypothetical protein
MINRFRLRMIDGPSVARSRSSATVVAVAETQVTRHQAVFGSVPMADVWQLLERHLQDHLGSGIRRVIFEAGDVGAVFGLALTDGREVVLKAHLPSSDLDRLELVGSCQALLHRRGFPCAAVLSPPSTTAGVPIVVEELLQRSSMGSPHDPTAVIGMAAGLEWQVRLLRDVPGEGLNPGRPAWANFDSGAWPVPHHPIFDFTAPAAGYEWVDRRADVHAGVLQQVCVGLPKVVGHTDWVWQNVAVRQGQLAAGYDWDSLVFLPEAVIVGLSAGAYTQGSPVPPDAPDWRQVTDFLDRYQQLRGVPFSADEAIAARHAAGWVRCYNARCQIDNQERRGMLAPAGSFIEMIKNDDVDHGDTGSVGGC